MGTDHVKLHDASAEGAVISALLVGNQKTLRLCNSINPDVFYFSRNKKLYNAIKSLVGKAITVDLITVLNELKDKELRIYLNEVADVVFTDANILYHYEIIKEFYDKRMIYRELDATLNEIDILDPDEIKTKLTTIIKDATLFDYHEGVQSMNDIIVDVVNDIDDNIESKRDIGSVFSGFKDIDRKVRFPKGEITVVAARTSVGKTSFILTILWRMAQRGLKIIYFTNETSKVQTMHKILGFREGLSDRDISNLPDDEYVTMLSRLHEYLLSDQISFDICSSAKTEADLINELNIRTSEINVDVICVDLINKIKIDSIKSKSYQLEDVMINLGAYASKKNLVGIILAQINRDGETDGKTQTIEDMDAAKIKSTPMPAMRNLKSSGAIEESAAVVALLWRPFGKIKDHERNGEAYLIIEKNRYGEVGIVKLTFHPKTTEFLPYGGW